MREHFKSPLGGSLPRAFTETCSAPGTLSLPVLGDSGQVCQGHPDLGLEPGGDPVKTSALLEEFKIPLGAEMQDRPPW